MRDSALGIGSLPCSTMQSAAWNNARRVSSTCLLKFENVPEMYGAFGFPKPWLALAVALVRAFGMASSTSTRCTRLSV